MSKKFGYARVSTKDQNLDLQINALKKDGCHPSDIFVEKISSRKKERPVFKELLSKLEADDTLIIWKLDRIGRSLRELVEIMDELNKRGIHLKTLTGNLIIDTSTAQGKLMYNITAAFAEYERDINKERVTAGLEAAIERGVKLGRKAKLTEEEVNKIRQMRKAGISIKEITEYFNIGRTTYYRYTENK